MNVRNVGEFTMRNDHWECAPEALGEAILSIESERISPEQEERARLICRGWREIVNQSLNYVEARRSDYLLEAKILSNPNVFVSSGEEWSIYFDTEHEYEAIVGVEYRGDLPFQLVIGD